MLNRFVQKQSRRGVKEERKRGRRGSLAK